MTKKNWEKVKKVLCELRLGDIIDTTGIYNITEIGAPAIKEILELLVKGGYIKKEKEKYRLLRHPVKVTPEKCDPVLKAKQLNKDKNEKSAKKQKAKRKNVR